MRQREVLTVHTFSILSCSLLTTFATLHGRYRWLRLPFGLCVSSEIFQKHLNQELLGLPGVKCIADDVLIYGRDDADHDSCLESFMKKCQQKGITLNRAKLEYLKPLQIASIQPNPIHPAQFGPTQLTLIRFILAQPILVHLTYPPHPFTSPHLTSGYLYTV